MGRPNVSRIRTEAPAGATHSPHPPFSEERKNGFLCSIDEVLSVVRMCSSSLFDKFPGNHADPMEIVSALDLAAKALSNLRNGIDGTEEAESEEAQS